MFIETRGNDKQKPSMISFSQAILNPAASFGGLYVPEMFPIFDEQWFQKAKDLNYKELCLDILEKFDLDITCTTLKEAISLYDTFDNKHDPIPLTKLDDVTYINELYHGPSRAFKDIALQPFGSIFSNLAQDEKYLILTATSGDTGPATLQSFQNKDNIKVFCLYPDGGTSDVQRLQMLTSNAKNLKVVGIKGDFDDAQRTLKELLNSQEFNEYLKQKNYKLSVANSVNFGRIIFQIIYHFSGYLKLLKSKIINDQEEIYLSIPSGNFGNALGAYYAKKMGLPIKKIVIASNINNILTELINTGIYDIKDRKLLKTNSPAMDILVSSNVERVLFDKFGAIRCKELMQNLEKYKKYTLNQKELTSLQEDFLACYCDDKFTKKTIRKYANKSMILDPHTATCLKAKEILPNDCINIICSTAEWTKFAPCMLNALNDDDEIYDDKKALKEFSDKTDTKICKQIQEIFSKDITHDDIANKEQIQDLIKEFLGD